MSEPTIMINGHLLNEGQAMAVRVAVGYLLCDARDPLLLGDDEHGRYMTKAYRERLSEVAQLMLGANDAPMR